MLRFALLALCLFLSACQWKFDSSDASPAKPAAPVSAGTPEQQQQALEAATTFAQALDSGHADATWETASPLLHGMMSRQTWVTAIGGLRSTMGTFERRRFKGGGFLHEVEGLPHGDYCVIYFTSDFANLSGVEEKVVLHSHEGRWKVVGYFFSKKMTANFGG